jgi:DNA-binding protein HU-beta
MDFAVGLRPDARGREVAARSEEDVLIKLDIINEVVNRTGITKTKAELAVETVFESMKRALGQGERIELRGFGIFNEIGRASCRERVCQYV